MPALTGARLVPVQGRTAVLAEDFARPRIGPDRRWGWKSGAYPDCPTNPADFKLDRLTRSALATADGVLTVTATPQQAAATAQAERWRTGLVSTGDTCASGGNGFQVRTGDVVAARVRLPQTTSGAWPGIWTWRAGGNEIDLFEWHADRPDTLEFANHTRDHILGRAGTGMFWTWPGIRPGRWLDVAVRLGARRVTWYVGLPPGPLRAVHGDERGVGPDFHAHLAAGLSIDDGRLHARPTGPRPITFRIASLTVHRSGQAPRSRPDPLR
ncbi:hypothetical protein [Actinomadura parmotrematis]|uniref:hypothetical protein n=1 Tax=Actinomadura parmotrematis TaxID=2864039 RepID=UPI0027E397B4|nr:hypothetical protein [Actinomadura parmotrematis]